MKNILLLVSILSFNVVFGQSQDSLSKKEWGKIVTLLSGEKWHDAEKLTGKYLKRFDHKNDSLADPAILRYMYLRCIAAQFGEKTYDKETALKKVDSLKGKSVITPPLIFNQKRMFNGLALSDDKKSFFSCASNNSMTIIQEFENYYFSDSTTVSRSESLTDKSLRIGCFIKSIDAEGFTMPRFKVVFENAFIWDEE